jgi:hypothetical protein
MELFITDEEYRARPEYSQSLVKEVLKKTPKVFDYEVRNRKPASKFMDFGSMLHCKLLEPHLFDSRYKVFDVEEFIDDHCEMFYSDHKKTTKAYKAELQTFKEEGTKWFIVENEDYKTWEKSSSPKLTTLYKQCKAQFAVLYPDIQIVEKEVYNSVLEAEKSAREYLPMFEKVGKDDSIKTEFAIANKIFGHPFKGKLDLIDLYSRIILDVKNTVDSLDDETLEKHVLKWDFPIQASGYCELAKEEYGGDWTFIFCMVNSFPPYECRLISMSDELTHDKMVIGREYLKEGLEKLELWSNNDPSFYRMSPYINDSVPPWYRKKYRETGENV